MSHWQPGQPVATGIMCIAEADRPAYAEAVRDDQRRAVARKLLGMSKAAAVKLASDIEASQGKAVIDRIRELAREIKAAG